VVLCAAAAGACDARQEEAPAPEPPPLAVPRPELRQDTILIEGMPALTTGRLLTLSAFATPLSTYVPDGITSHVEAVGDSGAVRFSAAFTDRTDPNAYMHVRLYPTGTSLPAAREVVASFLRSRRPQDDPMGTSDLPEPQEMVEAPQWALEAHAFDYQGDGGVQYVGRIILARYGARFFHVLTHYPAEYGDGLAPRFEYILEHWRWEHSAEALRD
jgi:hypothetical protein